MDTPGDPRSARRNRDMDERVSIPARFEDAVRALLKVDPATIPAEPNGKPEKRPANPRKK